MAGEDRRTHPRVDADISVEVRLANDNKQVPDGRSRNIRVGGVFIEMQPFGFGTELTLSIRLRQQAGSLTCNGFLVWSTKDNDRALEAGDLEGCGIRFAGLCVADMPMLAEFTEERRHREEEVQDKYPQAILRR